MAIRKRIWKTKSGETREAWVVDYYDQAGERHVEAFAKKKDADASTRDGQGRCQQGHPRLGQQVDHGGGGWQLWADAAEAEGLQRATVKTYREHVNLHIVPLLGRTKLSDISVPVVAKFKQKLRDSGRSARWSRR